MMRDSAKGTRQHQADDSMEGTTSTNETPIVSENIIQMTVTPNLHTNETSQSSADQSPPVDAGSPRTQNNAETPLQHVTHSLSSDAEHQVPHFEKATTSADNTSIILENTVSTPIPNTHDNELSQFNVGQDSMDHQGSPRQSDIQPSMRNDDDEFPVKLERLWQYQRNIKKFNAVEHYVYFRFTNLATTQSFENVIHSVHNAIHELLNTFMQDIGPNDLVQLRLDDEGLNRSLYSFRRSKYDLDAESFLNNVANLLQSNSEILGNGSLRLIIIIVRNREGGVMNRKRLSSTFYSEIPLKKGRWLFNFNNDNNNLCLAASLCALLENKDTNDSMLLQQARAIHDSLCIPSDRLVSFSDIPAFEKHLNVTIKVLHYENGEWRYFHTDTPCKDRVLFLYFENNHFYGIKKMSSFIGSSYFCDYCHTSYQHKGDHSCRYFCKACNRKDCMEDKTCTLRCPSCRTFCRSQECLTTHNNLALSGKIQCKTKHYCEKCGRYKDKNHEISKCKGLKCPVCHTYIETFDGHLCYMTKYNTEDPTDKYIFYDFECVQEEGAHIPNYAHALPLNGDKGWEFQGKTCLSDFQKMFIKRRFCGFTFIAHNAGRYDSYFVVQQLLKEKIKIDILAQGGKLLCVTVNDYKIRFIDSFNFLPMKLSKLPQALGFKGSKGHFPHLFNTEQNQNYIGPMPSKEYYGYEYMMPDEKGEFVAWYEENQHQEFNFQHEIKKYCSEDVNILKQACVCYRNSVMEMTRGKVNENPNEKPKEMAIDPFQFTTLASVCMAMFRLHFLPENTIAILPPDNYHKKQKRFSTPAIQWLMFLAHKEGISIQHALQGGEIAVGNYYLDGFSVIDDKPTAFEFLGCYFHGCPICYDEKDFNRVVRLTYGQLHHKTEIKRNFLKSSGFEVREIWEHEWKSLKETDKDLQTFLSEKDFPQPMDPREALYGGRTNAVKLYHKAAPGESIHYYDFTSLYPFVNKTKTYPTGHPTIIYDNFQDFGHYFGIAKVKVYPPKGLFFPVLPIKINGKLMFPLCHTCASNNQTTVCEHGDDERALSGTWCTVEIQQALEKGYTLCKIYEIWHFEQKTSTLFENYIKLHLRDKQEASGYPSWCTDDEKKQKYINDYYDKEGVALRPENIAVNPARRQISKLFLNSLWGKFGQRNNLPNTKIVTDPDEFFRYVFLPQYDLTSLGFLDVETASVLWKYTKDCDSLSRNSNIFIACFTTAYARLELYKVLDGLQERCLYHDTDSVIFVSKEGDWNPPLGDHLGDLTSELPAATHITEFVSTGPKTYGYKLSTGKGSLKAKGITLNAANIQKINFESIKDLVMDYLLHSDTDEQKKIVIQWPGIVRSKRYWTTETRPLQKTQKCVYTKRQLADDFTTLPFGY